MRPVGGFSRTSMSLETASAISRFRPCKILSHQCDHLVLLGSDASVAFKTVRSGCRDVRKVIACWLPAQSFPASPATHVGYQLIGAGMLILAGGGRGLPMDYDELERWTRVGYERGTRSGKGER